MSFKTKGVEETGMGEVEKDRDGWPGSKKQIRRAPGGLSQLSDCLRLKS